MARILIVDDEAPILNLMAKSCRQQGHTVTAVLSAKESREMLDSDTPEVFIVDLIIGDMNGLDLIRYCAETYPNVKMIMVTGNGSVETAVEAMRLGAFDYLTKPFELVDLQRTINLALQQKGAIRHTPSTPHSESAIAAPSIGIIGNSPKMKHILEVTRKIANIDSPILLEGEFGSGKRMVARSIHDASRRKDSPFKVLQCSAMPEELLENELFGNYSDGRETIFARAAGGTVLLEEIQVLPLRLQSKLDNFLDQINSRRQIGDLPPHLDVRFIASSATPLQESVEAGQFREDLYYKISIIPIDVPPLRSRTEDISVLAEHFLQQYAERTGSAIPEIDKYARRLLEGYSWPGNVGELQNAIERACAFAEDNRIRPSDLPPKVTQKVEITDDDELTTHHLPIGSGLQDYIRKQEKLFIRETLKYNGGSREKAASMLGVSIATLYRKMGLKLDKV